MNRLSENHLIGRNLILFAIGLFCIMMLFMKPAAAYFSDTAQDTAGAVVDVDNLFGHLTNPPNPTAPWGTEGNPFLIYENRHLLNLYSLQNQKDITAINENTVFQVSTPEGNPCYVGGSSINDLLEIPSIGSEDFPFISTIRGVTTSNPVFYATLPGNQISDTSTLGNLRVLAYEGQIDIGLFGNVGRPDPNDPDGTNEEIVTTGYIGNLLLSNIQISSDTTGAVPKPEHTDYFSTTEDLESNHVGILAGHAQYCRIENISVHYTTTIVSGKPVAALNAFEILADQPTTQYTTAGGILGFYKQIMVAESALPVNYNGVNTSGGLYSGFGLGILYSEDIWEYMEEIYGAPMTNSSYGLQQTQELNNLYADTVILDGLEKTYFKIGVFTFVHSRQSLSEDRIAKLWEVQDSNLWSISSTGTYNTPSSQTLYTNGKKYLCTELNASNLTAASGYYTPSTSVFGTNYTAYRFMVVYEKDGIQYALMKYGETVAAQKIDTSNFIIPEDQLVYYTFRVGTTRSVIGTTPDGLTRYSYGSYAPLRLNGSGYTSYNLQYLCYGQTITNSSGLIVEEERPLRIYDTLSYMYSSSSTNFPEGVRLYKYSSNYTFYMKRSYSSSSTLSNYLQFTVGRGYITTTSSSSATYVKIYAVKVAPETNPSGGGTDFDYAKEIYTPTSATSVTYDMSQNVLFYSGTYNSDTPSLKYRYQLKSLESLNWPNNKDFPIDSVDSVLKMADPSSFYYLNNTFYGILRNIPMPDNKVLYAPRASVAFTVNGTGIANDMARINVIVATDPSQLVDQMIEVSYFNTNTSGVPSKNRIIYESATFVLPPVPGSPVSGGLTSRTTPIMVSTDGGSSYITAYPNLNTLLIAYTVSVPCTTSRSYFLYSAKGSANFVYCSVEKTASNLSNPKHKNDAFFEVPNGIDYVFDIESGSDRKIVTINDSAYVQSLILPSFGIVNTSSTDTSLVIVNARNFTYSILRVYDTTESNYKLYIDIIAPGESPPNTYQEIIEQMNFNFYDATYYDTTLGLRVFSDIVIMTINNVEVDWNTIYT
jgi:hypothetical protein